MAVIKKKEQKERKGGWMKGEGGKEGGKKINNKSWTGCVEI